MGQALISVAVTEPELRKAIPVFESAPFACIAVPPEEDALSEAIRKVGARHAIVGTQPYRGKVYDALCPGAVIARFGVGHDQIDKRRATAAGIFCTNTPGVLDDSVAEHTVSLMLAAARQIPRLTAAMRAGDWTPATGRELRGRTLAIIGCGPIGTTVARIASRGFEMHVIGCYRRSRPRQADSYDELTTDFAAAVAHADFVSLHIPATPENTQFLNAARLALLAPGAWLLNTARGSIVEESSLYDALRDNRLAGAALDVFPAEPYVPADPHKDLRSLPNTILTPHVGSNTEDANRRMAERALRNVALAVQGDYACMDLLNPEVLERQAS